MATVIKTLSRISFPFLVIYLNVKRGKKLLEINPPFILQSMIYYTVKYFVFSFGALICLEGN